MPRYSGTQHVNDVTYFNAQVFFTENVSAGVVPSSEFHVANKAYVDLQITNLIDGAPEVLDTLNELAAALADDENYAATIQSQFTAITDDITDLQSQITDIVIDLDSDQTSGVLPLAKGGLGVTTAGEARTVLGVDPAGTDNSTDVVLDTEDHDYLSITDQEITLGPIDLATDVVGTLLYSYIADPPYIPQSGVDFDPPGTYTNVAVDSSSHDYITTSGPLGQTLVLGPINLTDDTTGNLPYSSLSGAPTIPQSGIDFDPVGTDNSTNVTLDTSSHSYLSLNGQEITLSGISLTSNVTNVLPITSGGTGETTTSAARVALLPTLGTTGQVLAVNSAADDVEFVDISSSGGITEGEAIAFAIALG